MHTHTPRIIHRLMLGSSAFTRVPKSSHICCSAFSSHSPRFLLFLITFPSLLKVITIFISCFMLTKISLIFISFFVCLFFWSLFPLLFFYYFVFKNVHDSIVHSFNTATLVSDTHTHTRQMTVSRGIIYIHMKKKKRK